MDQHFCTACGHQLGSGDNFCTACGTRIDEATSANPTAVSAAPEPAPAPPPVFPMSVEATAVRRSVPPQTPRPPRRRSRLGFWVWVAAAAVLVALVSFGLGTLTSSHDDSNTAEQPGNGTPAGNPGGDAGDGTSSALPTTAASPDPQAMAQARALHSLIQHSAVDKHKIAVAAAQLQSCRHVKQGVQAFEDAASSRDQLVDDASGLQVGLLPGGGAAIASFSKALRASADADRAYVAFGQKRHKVPDGKRRHHHQPMKCTGGKDLEQQAVRLSSASHAAKQQTAKEWNVIAAQFKLPKIVWTSL